MAWADIVWIDAAHEDGWTAGDCILLRLGDTKGQFISLIEDGSGFPEAKGIIEARYPDIPQNWLKDLDEANPGKRISLFRGESAESWRERKRWRLPYSFFVFSTVATLLLLFGVFQILGRVLSEWLGA